MEKSTYRVLADYEISDRHPLLLRPGDPVTVLKKDSGWPGWVWISSSAQAGWFPLSHLVSVDESPAVVSREFDGTELSASKGEILTSLHEESGWVFAENQRNEKGWFPLFNLKPALDE